MHASARLTADLISTFIDNNILFHGTTRNVLTMVDTRKDNSSSGAAVTIKNDSMVNSMYADGGGFFSYRLWSSLHEQWILTVRVCRGAFISYVYHDGLTVISGDSSGYIKTWDVRTGRVLQSVLNEPTKKPISHIAVSKQRGSLDGVSLAETEEPESRWLAANSYDNGMVGPMHVQKKGRSRRFNAVANALLRTSSNSRL